jgi:hypothetical protein
LTPPKLYRATEPIPAISAATGDFIMDDGKKVCVLHQHDRATLTPDDWLKMRPTRRLRSA